MSIELEEKIKKITANALARVEVRVGSGMSMTPSKGGKPLLSRLGSSGDSSSSRSTGYPRAGIPRLHGNEFLLNLIPLRENAEDLSVSIPLSNVKIYVRMKMTPVAYASPGPLFGISYANVDNLDVMTVPHGTLLPPVDATVNGITGAVTQGTYYFFCAKVFSDGTILGLSGSDGPDDTTYFYSNIVTVGWLFSPAGTHYPPIDLV